MKTSAVLLGLVVVLALVASGCASPTQETSSSAALNSNAPKPDATVNITNGLKFDPAKAASVALPAGAAPFDSGDIAQGKTFTYTFTVPGRYRYFCKPHEKMGMIGEVEVQPALRETSGSQSPAQ